MDNEKDLNKELQTLYKEWADNIDEKFLTDDYSNPYYISIPTGWCKSKNKIMIVGEEGAGSWGCGKTVDQIYNTKKWNRFEIELIQKYNEENIDFQCERFLLMDKKDYISINFKKSKGKFWKRFKNVYNLSPDVKCIWNNNDKIHRVNTRSNNSYALYNKERKQLHKNTVKILAKEIEKTETNLVLFFGWHWVSLELELPEVYNELCKRDWKKITVIKLNNITYIFSYHPQRKNKEYENELIKTIERELVK